MPSTSLPSPAAGAYRPRIDPSQFSVNVDNPWFPLKPGTVFVYEGSDGGKATRDVFTVTRQTKMVDGVRCVVVHDVVYTEGTLAEETFDYYSQDLRGNVWYFGEDTKELTPSGKVKTREGTWHGGVDGAQPGLFMEAHPAVGHSYRQEYYRGHAEDRYQVVSLTASIKVPFGSFRDVELTKEWTALEPDVLDHKYYALGVGEVAEQSVKGGSEILHLVRVSSG